MTVLSFFYTLLVRPLEYFFETIYSIVYRTTSNPGLSIIFLSIAMNIMLLPLYNRADAIQEEEKKQISRMKKGVEHIKRIFHGDERYMMLQTYYRQNNYKQIYVLKGSISLLLEVPFFLAAYSFLSTLLLLRGSTFGPIIDLGAPDALIYVFNTRINVLPILMTIINIVSGAIYTKGQTLHNKIQLYGMALLFLVLLYQSPAGLVLYWTLNNTFSLVKNIISKKHINKKILIYLYSVFGIALVLFSLFRSDISITKRIILTVCGLSLLMMTVIPYFQKRKHIIKQNSPIKKNKVLLFELCCIFLTVLVGLFIPTDVIKTSPAEFIDKGNLQNPLFYLINSIIISSGIFLVWFNVFYWMLKESSRNIFEYLVAILSMVFFANYMFFGRDYGNMSALFQYDGNIALSLSQIIINGFVIIMMAVLVIIIMRKKAGLVQVVCASGSIVLLCMSIINANTINEISNRTIAIYQNDEANAKARIPLDKKGKNVIVIMLDRGINMFFPYLLAEKPELQNQFEGFTYYSNVISYGSHTNVGSPGLFGGYEYIPSEMNKRTEMTLEEKHNESLFVMPVLFKNQGYKVTVCDPPYAGYSWIPDLSVFDKYPSINKYITKGSFSVNEGNNIERTNQIRNRNIVYYSLFRVSPLVFHIMLYNNGQYNELEKTNNEYSLIDDSIMTEQTVESPSKATGLLKQFMDSYSVLKSLTYITDIYEDGSGTFLMLTNDTTHDAMLLQEPEYEPRIIVDNSEYDNSHTTRKSLIDNKELILTTDVQFAHYQSNMAAMIQLGEWFDYLKKNNVYDNTRIIIVSDHGRHLFLKGNGFGPDKERWARYDPMMYQSLLLVKDFDSHSFTVSDDFMTNADTPSLALEGIVDNPKNPFTQREINDTGIKGRDCQYIAYAVDYNPATNNGNVFKDIIWMKLDGHNANDMDKWSVYGETLE